MFDNIGKDLDEEANKRRAASFFVTVATLGAVTGSVLFWGARKVVEEFPELVDEEMVEVLLDEPTLDEAPPPPPPPPPPAASAPDEEEEEEEEEVDPDEMQEDVEELEKEVEKEMKSDKKPKGEEGGQEGGVEGGVIGGVQGGVIGGELGGTLGGGIRVFHHSELEVKKRVQPRYPQTAEDLNLGDQRCLVKVFIDEKGVPYDVVVEQCPKVFHAETKETILKWRWYPPKDGRDKVRGQTTIGVTYKMH